MGAALLAQAAKTDSEAARIRHRFHCRFIDAVVAKGMAAETRVYELLEEMPLAQGK